MHFETCLRGKESTRDQHPEEQVVIWLQATQSSNVCVHLCACVSLSVCLCLCACVFAFEKRGGDCTTDHRWGLRLVCAWTANRDARTHAVGGVCRCLGHKLQSFQHPMPMHMSLPLSGCLCVCLPVYHPLTKHTHILSLIHVLTLSLICKELTSDAWHSVRLAHCALVLAVGGMASNCEAVSHCTTGLHSSRPTSSWYVPSSHGPHTMSDDAVGCATIRSPIPHSPCSTSVVNGVCV